LERERAIELLLGRALEGTCQFALERDKAKDLTKRLSPSRNILETLPSHSLSHLTCATLLSHLNLTARRGRRRQVMFIFGSLPIFGEVSERRISQIRHTKAMITYEVLSDSNCPLKPSSKVFSRLRLRTLLLLSICHFFISLSPN